MQIDIGVRHFIEYADIRNRAVFFDDSHHNMVSDIFVLWAGLLYAT